MATEREKLKFELEGLSLDEAAYYILANYTPKPTVPGNGELKEQIHASFTKRFGVSTAKYPDGKEVDVYTVPVSDIDALVNLVASQAAAAQERAEFALLQKYFELVDESKRLKAERVVIAREYGQCESDPNVSYGRCYQEERLAFSAWCLPCQKKEGASKRLHANAYERVAIINRLRKLAAQQKEPTKKEIEQ